MALRDKYKRKAQETLTSMEKLKVERARSAVSEILQSDQFKLSALALPEERMNVDAIVKTTISAVYDPEAQFIDTLKNKGYRPAEIRNQVHRLWSCYINVGANAIDDDSNVPYDKMLNEVAIWMVSHQEVYNSLDPANLRE